MSINKAARTVSSVSLLNKVPYVFPPTCDNNDCLNGIPTMDTYCLCEVCFNGAPDAYDHGIAVLPSSWKKPSSNPKEVKDRLRKRRIQNATSMSVRLMMKKTKERKDM